MSKRMVLMLMFFKAFANGLAKCLMIIYIDDDALLLCRFWERLNKGLCDMCTYGAMIVAGESAQHLLLNSKSLT